MLTTEKKIQIKSQVRRFLADTVTPVTLYLKARDHFTEPVLLENNDFRSKEDCYSFLGLDVIASFQVKPGQITEYLPGGEKVDVPVQSVLAVPNAMQEFLKRFEVSYDGSYADFNGLIGYTGFDGVQYFDTLQFDPAKRKFDLPDIR